MSQSMRKFQQNTHETSRPDIIWTTILTARLVSLGVLLCQQSGTLLGDQINAPLNQTLLREDQVHGTRKFFLKPQKRNKNMMRQALYLKAATIVPHICSSGHQQPSLESILCWTGHGVVQYIELPLVKIATFFGQILLFHNYVIS